MGQTNQIVFIRGSTTKMAQAKLFENLFSGYGGVKTTRAKRGTIEQSAFLDRSFEFLLPKQDMIESWIGKCPRCFLAFFAGYFDAEGSLLLHKGKSGVFGGFEIQTYDKQIIFQSWARLRRFSIYCPRPSISKSAGYISSNGVRHNGDAWRLSIYAKESVWILLHFMKRFLKHGDKLKALLRIEENIIERNQARRGGKVIALSIPHLPLHSHVIHSAGHASTGR